MQKLIRRLPKRFANCVLWTANSNPVLKCEVKGYQNRKDFQCLLYCLTIFFQRIKFLDCVISNISWINVWITVGGAPTSICNFFHPSVRRTAYLRKRRSSDHNFWYTYVKWWYLQDFFHFFKILFFGAVSGVKGWKIAQNEK